MIYLVLVCELIIVRTFYHVETTWLLSVFFLKALANGFNICFNILDFKEMHS